MSAVASGLNAFPTHSLAATAASAVASGLEASLTHLPSAPGASAAPVVPSGLEAFPPASPTASGGIARDLPDRPNEPQPNQLSEKPTGRVLGAQTAAASASTYITLDQFSAGLSGLGDIVARAFGTAGARVPEQVAAAGNAGLSGFFPASQRIDQLTNTAINTPTITGGAISGASSVGARSGSFDALAAGTLALSGALTGTDASFSGTLSAGVLNVAGLSSQGALIGPYFTATSTTATSSFAGGLTAANGGFSILQNGNVGIGTTSPGALLSANGNILGAGTLALTGTTGTTTIASGQGFTIGGSQFVVQQGSGKVGIGTASPFGKLSLSNSANSPSIRITASNAASYAPLEIYSDTYGAYIDSSSSNSGHYLLNAVSGGTSRLYVRNDGNVGIGTTNPGALLDVNGNARLVMGNAESRALTFINTTSGNIGGQVVYNDATGIFNINNQIAFPITISTNNAERLRIDSTGNVGIGTTSPTNKLEVAGNIFLGGTIVGTSTLALTGTTGTTTIASGQGFTIGGSQFVVQQGSGNVGIGMANPAHALDVAGNIRAGSSATNGILRVTTISNTTGTSNLYLERNDGTLQGYVGAFGPSHGQTFAGVSTNDLTALVGNTGSLMLYSANALHLATAGTERMRITSTGYVGIGTTTPGDALTIQGSGNSAGATLGMRIDNATLSGALRFETNNSGGYPLLDARSGDLTFRTGGSANNGGNEWMRLTQAGNVGIGTTTPENTLDVNGTAAFRQISSFFDDMLLRSGKKLTMYRNNVDSYAWSMYSDPGNTLMLTTGVGGSGTTRLSITDSGVLSLNGLAGIGLGGATPSARLQIARPDDAFPATSGSTQSSGLVMRLGSDSQSVLDFGMHSSAGAWLQATNPALLQINYPLLLNPNGGNVGIGTTSPANTFSVAGKGYFTSEVGIGQTPESGGNNLLNIAGVNGNGIALGDRTVNGTIYVGRTSGGGLGGNSGWIGFGGDGTASNNWLSFSGYGAEQMRITKDGNVGIGTTTPGAKLDVLGDQWLSLTANQTRSLNFHNLTNNTTYGRLQYTDTTGVLDLANLNAYPVTISTNGSERLRVNSSGNVGIGTTTPSRILSIAQAGAFSNAFASASNPAVAIVNTNSTSLNEKAEVQLGLANGIGYSTVTGLYEAFNGAGDIGTALAFGTQQNLAGGTVERLRITATGNVGIGTTTPIGKLQVSSANDLNAISIRSGATNAFAALSLGRTSSETYFGIAGVGNNFTVGSAEGDTVLTTAGVGKLHFSAQSSGLSSSMVIDTAGNVGIGTTTPTAQLSTTGTVRFAGLGSAGANLITDALGNVTASSDERLKDKQGDFSRGLAAINAISPVLYKWRPETGFDTQSTYAGFFAQNVQAAIPEAVSEDSRGYLTLADRPILAALVNATKEIGTVAGAFKASLITWLGSASNGIGDLFAKDIYATNGTFDTTTANTTNTRELCITNGANDNAPLCLTKSQLAALLSQSATANLPASVISGAPSDAPDSVIPQAPVIELNGNASSTLDLGDAYHDLGARITAPTSDLNLGITILLDGATTTQVSIDTSEPGEHTIIYTVTSPTTGLTTSVMRTVVVSPAAQTPAQPPTDFGMPAPPQPATQPSDEPANDNPFNALAPANDNASSTPTVDAAA